MGWFGDSVNPGGTHGAWWRWPMWGGAALLLCLPAVAMRYTDEVRWEAASFIVMGLLLATVCGLVELGARLSGHWAYRLGFAVAAGTGFMTVWVNLAVGMLGDEDNPENLMFAGVLAIAAFGALAVRFRPRGMAQVMVATAVAMAGTVVYAAAIGELRPAVLMTAWVLAWSVSAMLFARAAAARSPLAG